MAERKIRTYTSDDVAVTYDLKRCIHARECVKGLPAVFDVNKRPWIQPDQATADEVAEVVQRCPTGALHFIRKDGGDAEPTPDENNINIVADGPLYVHGDITLKHINGDTMLNDMRIALCRCGQSGDKPFCDNSHKDAGFTADGLIPEDKRMVEASESGGKLDITPGTNGPLALSGNFTITDATGETVFSGDKCWLCRCGASANKPFCDGTHNKIDFEAE